MGWQRAGHAYVQQVSAPALEFATPLQMQTQASPLHGFQLAVALVPRQRLHELRLHGGLPLLLLHMQLHKSSVARHGSLRRCVRPK